MNRDRLWGADDTCPQGPLRPLERKVDVAVFHGDNYNLARRVMLYK